MARWASLAGLLWLVIAESAAGQTLGPPVDSHLERGKWEGSEADPRPFADTLLGDGLLRPGYFAFKQRIWEEQGLDFGAYYSVNEQVGSSGGKWHGSGEMLALGTWEPLRRPRRVGRLVFGFALDNKIGRTTEEFAKTQDLVEDPDDLDTGGETTTATLGLLSWEQEFHLDRRTGWGVRAGQIFAASYFGISRYLDDDRRNFLARPLAAAAGNAWVGDRDIGLGVNVVGWRNPFYASVAVLDAKAKRRWPDFESVWDGELLYVGEVGYERDDGGSNETAVRVTAAYLDLDDGDRPEKGPGWSLAVTGLHRFDGRFAVFGRWTGSWDRLSASYRQLVSVGGAWTRPFGRSEDFLGLGFWIADPSDGSKHSETGLELSYRIQLTQAVSVMPDVQYWHRARSGADVDVVVSGIRLNFEL